MKKLMMALAVVALAMSAQSATILWKMGTSIKPDGASNAASGTLNMYVWTVSESVYNSTDIDDIWGTYGNTAIASITGFDASITGKGGAAGGNASQTVTAPTTGTDTYYGLIITTYDSDLDGKVDMYAANKTTATMNTAGTAGGNTSNLARYIGGQTSGGAVTWEAAAIPEPTTGLLVLLGVAGLALRRRRA